MRKLFTHPVSLLILMLVVIWVLFVGGKKVQWFSWFGLWTQKKNTTLQSDKIYLQKNAIDDILTQVLNTHAKLSLGVHVTLWTTSSSSDVPSFLSNVQRVLGTDINAYLENSSDKSSSLDSLIGQMDYYQSQWNNFDYQIQQYIQQQTLDYNACDTAKQLADAVFFQWLHEWDSSVMQQWLSDSQTNGACQTKARININAYKAMLNRVQSANSALTTISSLLTQNHDTIVNNYTLFKDSYLEKLLILRNTLQSNGAVIQ